MKNRNICVILSAFSLLAVLMCGCDKEENPVASDDVNIGKNFAPADDADPVVKKLYNDYGVWVRMDFDDPLEVANAIIANDPFYWNQYTTKIEDEHRASALTYARTLMGTVAAEFSNRYFPQELFFVKMYGLNTNLKYIGRARLVIAWPSQFKGALPVTEPAMHYFQDSLLAAEIWNKIGYMISLRMTEPLVDFVSAGKPYDGGKVFDEYEDIYDDPDEYEAAAAKYCQDMGYVFGEGSWSFEFDFAQWTALVALNSYDDIKANYLDNSPVRADKYKAFVQFFKDNGWDIQAAGNQYRQNFEENKGRGE